MTAPVLETISPETAKLWLEMANRTNRPMRTMHVSDLAQSIRKGQWRQTHQGVAFSADGELLDGQHRLAAIVEAGIPVAMWVWRGMHQSTMGVIDTGLKRSLSDRVMMPRRTIDVIAYYHRVLGNIHQPTADDIGPYKAAFLNTIIGLQEYCGAVSKRMTAAPVRAAAVICAIDRSREFSFKTYRAVALRHSEEYTPITHSFCRQVERIRTIGHPERNEIFCKSLRIFDQAYATLSTATVKNVDASMEGARSRIERILERAARGLTA